MELEWKASTIWHERQVRKEEEEFLKWYDANLDDFKSAFPNVRMIETNEDFDLNYLTYLDDVKRIETKEIIYEPEPLPEVLPEPLPEVLPEPLPEVLPEPEHFKTIEKREIVKTYAEVEDVRFNPIRASEYSLRGHEVQRYLIDWFVSDGYERVSYSENKNEPDMVVFKDGVFYVVSCKSWKLDNKRIKAGSNSRVCSPDDIIPEIRTYFEYVKQGKKVKLWLAFHNPLTEYWEFHEVVDVQHFKGYSTSVRFGDVG
jgi:hypothetical protein